MENVCTALPSLLTSNQIITNIYIVLKHVFSKSTDS